MRLSDKNVLGRGDSLCKGPGALAASPAVKRVLLERNEGRGHGKSFSFISMRCEIIGGFCAND